VKKAYFSSTFILEYKASGYWISAMLLCTCINKTQYKQLQRNTKK